MTTGDQYRTRAKAVAKRIKGTNKRNAGALRDKEKALTEMASNEDWLEGKPGSQLAKRPRDPNQLGKLIIDIATGQVPDRAPTPEEQGKSAKAVARGKSGGLKGGKARAASLTAEQRAEIARLAAQTRWKKSD